MPPTQLKGLDAFQVDHGATGAKIAVVCHKCGARQVGSDKVDCPPVRLAKHFAAAGWKIVRQGVQAVCPACQQKAVVDREPGDVGAELERQKVREELRLASSAPAVEAANGGPVEPSKDAARAQAHMHRLLSGHLSIEGEGEAEVGVYDDGWSDQRVSEVSGLALAEVIRWREMAYAPIVDPRIVAVEHMLAAARAKLEDDYTVLRDMAEQHRRDGLGALARVERQLVEARRLARAFIIETTKGTAGL